MYKQSQQKNKQNIHTKQNLKITAWVRYFQRRTLNVNKMFVGNSDPLEEAWSQRRTFLSEKQKLLFKNSDFREGACPPDELFFRYVGFVWADMG